MESPEFIEVLPDFGPLRQVSLLATWLPIIEEPITVVAGVPREPLPTFLRLEFIAKVGRYVVFGIGSNGGT